VLVYVVSVVLVGEPSIGASALEWAVTSRQRPPLLHQDRTISV
jgi:hypothetical protein